MKNVSIEQATKVQNELREILIKYNNPEFGDCIVDEICWLFGFPTTTDVEPEGDFVNDGNDYQLLDYVFHPFTTNEGFTYSNSRKPCSLDPLGQGWIEKK